MLVDLFPSILDLLDFSPQQGVRGVSLKPLLFGDRGDSLPNPRFRLAEYPREQALMLGSLKLIRREKSRELYDLSNDIEELNNLAGTMAKAERKLTMRAARLERSGSRDAGSEQDLPEITREMLEELRALGYADP